jgi:heptose-I-phosphate ethanolaminephosphotransferase
MRRIAIQGIKGSFHDIASHRYFENEELELICCDTFEQVFQHMKQEKDIIGLVAIENTIAGSLLHNYELLRDSGMTIVGEHKLRISHSIMCLPEDEWKDITEVNSHPVALMQCRNFLSEHDMKIVEVADTAGAAANISKKQLHGHAAICHKDAAQIYGMKILQETHINEVLEFMRSYGWWRVAAMALVIILLGVVVIGINVTWPVSIDAPQAQYLLFYLGLTLFLLWYSWKQRHGAFVRTGIAQMFAEVKEYVENNHLYSHMTARRLESLQVEPLGKPWSKPSTIVMVIGESACRDFMSAFTPMQEDTTPWLRQLADDHRHTLLFPNAYSCAMQTVPALERALTEYSQYNDKAFYESCSIVDVAHKLGYRVHWYSNQGHLGVSDTPITLVADTSDVAKWTHQQVNTVQYDEELLSFLDEIDPTQNNFVVLHLKGSHFNFMSRYPKSFTRWGEPGVQDNVVCYKNSIAYTDHVLEQFYQYGREKLNMQAMLYFSDHATEPGRRRKPNFDGFQMTRIPLFAWLSDEYIACHPERYEALKQNQDKYFTNDLAYDLVCGLLDIRSPHFDETASLASPHYRFTRDMLLTYEGKKHISEDVGQ